MIDDYFDTALEHNGLPARFSNYITDALTDAALRFVESNRSRPFFLFLSYNAPHIPNQVPLKYEQEYTEKGLSPHLAKVYGMITCLDDGIGRILEGLEKLGLEENTIVVFLSDNGPQMESSRQMQQFRSREWRGMDAMWKGVGRYNGNLRGEKATEGSVRRFSYAGWVTSRRGRPWRRRRPISTCFRPFWTSATFPSRTGPRWTAGAWLRF